MVAVGLVSSGVLALLVQQIEALTPNRRGEQVGVLVLRLACAACWCCEPVLPACLCLLPAGVCASCRPLSRVMCSQEAPEAETTVILQALAQAGFVCRVALGSVREAAGEGPAAALARQLEEDLRGLVEHGFRGRTAALQPAAAVAAAVQQFWATPERLAATRLEAAQAAAVRSCAYLRCANLPGFSGGAAAAEGAGSMRCSACRSVWYCGEACSHADWRAGHRRVCKALKDARQHAAA